MKKNLIVGGGVIGALIVGVFLYMTLDQGEVKEITATETPVVESPILKIEFGTVFVTKDGSERAAVDGEAILPPYELRSDATGKARLQFSDGSELRLDTNSKMSINSASYSPDSKSLVMSVKLTVGKVWSNIIALATPESSWEVETSNVVATVRGTAFGVVAEENGTTTILGSKHTVELTLIDPETGKRDPNRHTPLHEDEFIVITNDIAQDDSTEQPTPHKKTDKEQNDSWLKHNEDRDDSITVDAEGNVVITEDGVNPDDVEPDTVIPPVTPRVTTPQPTTAPTPTTKPNTSSKKAVSLSISSSVSLNGIIEGTPVKLKAVVTYSDGSTQDVSNGVAWKVIGKIGSIQGTVFTPLLDPSVAELGKSAGSITAVWTDAATSVQLMGATPVFEVMGRVTSFSQQG